MKGKLAKSVLVLAFIILLLVGIYPAKGDIVFNNDSRYKLVVARAPYISFPSNQTYDSGLLTLYVNFQSFNVGGITHAMSYSLDGKENETVALTEHYYFSILHHSPPNYCDGSVALPVLANGSHCITVYLECTHEVELGSNHTLCHDKLFESQTVYFAVLSPIALLMEKNQTYNTTEIPLDFIVDRAPSQVAYSLDFHENVTVTGNTTLTGLAEGTHTVIIYANNTWGNSTSIDINIFTIAPSPSQSTSPTLQIQNVFFLILILSVALVAITILLVLRKRKLNSKPHAIS